MYGAAFLAMIEAVARPKKNGRTVAICEANAAVTTLRREVSAGM